MLCFSMRVFHISRGGVFIVQGVSNFVEGPFTFSRWLRLIKGYLRFLNLNLLKILNPTISREVKPPRNLKWPLLKLMGLPGEGNF